MLAGPRKKQKISADPRNKQWVDDSNKFGLRLMQKMGWSDGKGLGANMDGKTENVKVVMKADTKGLGFNSKEEDSWIAHQDDFNDILSQLHQEHNDSEKVATVTPKSIEERSKKSKRRVHYKKFTQGKDLANRSVDDMNCILGKRSGSSTPKSASAPVSDNEDDGTIKLSHGVRTIVNSVSVKDYFAQKMSQMKRAKSINGDGGNSPQTAVFPVIVSDQGFTEIHRGNGSEGIQDAMEVSDKTGIDQEEHLTAGREETGQVPDGDGYSGFGYTEVKKKKKKRKRKQPTEESGDGWRSGNAEERGSEERADGNDINGINDGSDIGGDKGVVNSEALVDNDTTEGDCGENPVALKKRKKKKKKKTSKSAETIDR